MTDSGITNQCTGAAKPVVSKWTITCRDPVIADVIGLHQTMIRMIVRFCTWKCFGIHPVVFISVWIKRINARTFDRLK